MRLLILKNGLAEVWDQKWVHEVFTVVVVVVMLR